MSKEMSGGEARDVVDAAWAAGVRLFDTAPMYGHGLAEYRLGAALLEQNRDRDSYTLVTKVGRTLIPAPRGSFDSAPWVNTPPMRLQFDYSYDGVMRQIDDSLQRMATNRIDVLLVHDTDRFTHGDDQPTVFKEALQGAFRALVALRDQGVVKAIGIGVNEVDVCIAAAAAIDIDCVLIAGKYTLLDQSASDELFPLCQERGIAVINGRVFGSGILATGPDGDARFDYRPADADVRAKVRHIKRVCDAYRVSLGAAAVRFAARHPSVVNVCLGVRNVEQLRRNASWLEEEVPDGLWQELAAAGLLRVSGT